jgi:hypothetical protein
MIWTESKYHISDCYFCLTSIKGITTKSKHTVKYLNLSSAKRLLPHGTELLVPTSSKPLESEEFALSQGENKERGPTFELSLIF